MYIWFELLLGISTRRWKCQSYPRSSSCDFNDRCLAAYHYLHALHRSIRLIAGIHRHAAIEVNNVITIQMREVIVWIMSVFSCSFAVINIYYETTVVAKTSSTIYRKVYTVGHYYLPYYKLKKNESSKWKRKLTENYIYTAVTGIGLIGPLAGW